MIVIGAGLTGLSAAFHVGEHGLLLDRRPELEESHDHPFDIAVGATRVGTLGAEDRRAGREGPGVSATERRALFISCSSQTPADSKGAALIHVTRWQPPVLTPAPMSSAEPSSTPALRSPSARILAPLLRGEMRLNSLVVRVNPSERLLELDDGARFVFDKLISTIPLSALACLVTDELPGRVRHDAALRYWLQDHDIEVGDRGTRELYGDHDEFAAGRRLVERISPALAEKFRRSGRKSRVAPLFQPRLVRRVEA